MRRISTAPAADEVLRFATADCLIAATCLEAGAELYHNDRDFEAIAKVRRLKIYRH
jgi:predicted nucleic acid-binding protein